MRGGAKAVAPQLIGTVPFGLVAGATPVNGHLGAGVAAGFSTVVFAGASQLVAIDVLTHGGTVLVAVLAACTINLRMVLYSASLAPYLTRDRLKWRMLASYLLVDQVYAVAVTRWPDRSDPASAPENRIPFMLGAGLL
ncbi:MAG TPA: AzlC family ABC transporter permease, partial [Acidimicrobiia bacterium]|nr:AzlC family ABC transporter permease [Acidimicrobiia bacterium]